MGGHITVALRRRDGTTSCVGMWTNRMKAIFTDEEFMNGNLDALEREIREVLENQESGYGTMAPVPGEYGIIVVDEHARRIVNWSHYDAVSRLAWYDLGFRGYGRIMPDITYDAARRKALNYGDRLYYWDNGTNGFTTKDITRPETVEALAKMIEDHASEDDLRSTPEACVVLRFPGWNVVELHRWHEEDFHVAKAAIEEAFQLDASDQRLWDEEYRELHEKRGD